MRLVILLSIAASLLLTSASWAEPITPEQAKAAVRAFESNPNLQFSSVTLDDGSDPKTYTLPHQYELTYTGPQDTSIDWIVDAVSSEVIRANYNNFYPGEAVTEDNEDSADTGYTKEPHGPFTQQQCFKIAQDFIYSRISNFDSLNFKLVNDGNWNGYNWDFAWQEILPNGAKTPNGVTIYVNPDDGKVLDFLINKREFDGSNWASFITPEQAIQAVRDFEGNAGLQFSNVMLNHDDLKKSWEHPDEYMLSTNKTKTDTLHWDVDAISGEVTSVHYPDHCADNDSRDDTDTPVGSWTREQCRQVAEDFVRSHYSGFSVLNMQPDDEGTWNMNEWGFIWREVLPCGATTPNSVMVCVCPFDGKVTSYLATRIPMSTLLEPKLTAKQALEIIAKAIKIKNNDGGKELSLVANPEGIFWTGVVEDAESSSEEYWIDIDAVTGRIVRNERMVADCLSPTLAAGKASKRRISRGNNALAPIRRVVGSLSGASVQWISGTGAKLTFNGYTYTIKPNTKTVKCGNGSLALNKKPVLKNNRLLVPWDLLDKLVKTKYSSQDKAKSVKAAPVAKTKKK